MVIIGGISGLVGDYAVHLMSTSTMINDTMLIQIIFLAGLIAGILLCLAVQLPDRRYPVQNPVEFPQRNPAGEDGKNTRKPGHKAVGTGRQMV